MTLKELSILLIIISFYGREVFASQYEVDSYVISNSGGEWLENSTYSLRGASGQAVSAMRLKSQTYISKEGFYNPPRFSFQKKLNLEFSNKNLTLSLPANSVNSETIGETFDIFYDSNLSKEEEVFVNQANYKEKANKGIISFPLNIAKIGVMDDEEVYFDKFLNEGRISIAFSDANNDGIIDGTNPPVRANTLAGYKLSDSQALWLKTFDNRLNLSSKEVSFSFFQSGIYTIMGEIADSVKDAYAYPVPFRPNGPEAGIGPGKTGTEASGITFANIPQEGEIEIFTVDGLLVRKIQIPYGLAESVINWDTKNSSGEKVASGVYIWRLTSNGNSKTGKLVIIR